MALLKASTPAAKEAAEDAIAALKQGWSKGYLDLIDNYQTFQSGGSRSARRTVTVHSTRGFRR